MLQNLFGSVISFVLGDLIGPEIVIALILAVAVVCVIRGYRALAYVCVGAAVALGAFLGGTQLEKHRCAKRIAEIEDRIQKAEDAEKIRQKNANDEIRRLRNDNFRLTVREAEIRKQKNEPIIREIVRTQKVETCSSASWSDSEFKRLRDSIISRRGYTDRETD